MRQWCRTASVESRLARLPFARTVAAGELNVRPFRVAADQNRTSVPQWGVKFQSQRNYIESLGSPSSQRSFCGSSSSKEEVMSEACAILAPLGPCRAREPTWVLSTSTFGFAQGCQTEAAAGIRSAHVTPIVRMPRFTWDVLSACVEAHAERSPTAGLS